MYVFICTIDIDVFPCMVTMETCMDDNDDDYDYNNKLLLLYGDLGEKKSCK